MEGTFCCIHSTFCSTIWMHHLIWVFRFIVLMQSTMRFLYVFSAWTISMLQILKGVTRIIKLFIVARMRLLTFYNFKVQQGSVYQGPHLHQQYIKFLKCSHLLLNIFWRFILGHPQHITNNCTLHALHLYYMDTFYTYYIIVILYLIDAW